MASRVQDKPIAGALELLSEQGFEGMREAFEVLLKDCVPSRRYAWRSELALKRWL